ncbi:MAG TPA: hypothetical protein DEP88_07605 [Verrucomicrobiales bacterium]|nr:hypothetical protein [Verrucomicrobiales bacterium]HCI92717.1 hypothetical protein [Verrucomicrobiales bacterium]HCL97790.1 hypothetical protein [Verrucomicrobiales bacterium]
MTGECFEPYNEIAPRTEAIKSVVMMADFWSKMCQSLDFSVQILMIWLCFSRNDDSSFELCDTSHFSKHVVILPDVSRI